MHLWACTGVSACIAHGDRRGLTTDRGRRSYEGVEAGLARSRARNVIFRAPPQAGRGNDGHPLVRHRPSCGERRRPRASAVYKEKPGESNLSTGPPGTHRQAAACAAANDGGSVSTLDDERARTIL